MQLVPTAGFNSIIAAAFLLTGVGMVGAYGILLRSKRLLQLYCLTWVLCIIMQTAAGVATLAWLEQENNLANKLTTNGNQPLNLLLPCPEMCKLLMHGSTHPPALLNDREHNQDTALNSTIDTCCDGHAGWWSNSTECRLFEVQQCAASGGPATQVMLTVQDVADRKRV